MKFYNSWGDEVNFYEGMDASRFLVKFTELEAEREAHERTKAELEVISEFCKNRDPEKYVLCAKLEFDGTIKYWFELKEIVKQREPSATNTFPNHRNQR